MTEDPLSDALTDASADALPESFGQPLPPVGGRTGPVADVDVAADGPPAPSFGRRVGRAVTVLVRDIVEAAVLAGVLFFVLQFALQSTIVEGTSMEPNFFDDEWVMVNKLAYRFGEPRRGDVIVFHAPDGPKKDYIKRIIAVGGETVQLRSGEVFVDGTPIDEPWLPASDATAFGPFEVPTGQLFVLGDNRSASSDSRLWPAPGLDATRVVGKVWLSVWPRRAWGVVPSDAPPAGRRER